MGKGKKRVEKKVKKTRTNPDTGVSEVYFDTVVEWVDTSLSDYGNSFSSDSSNYGSSDY